MFLNIVIIFKSILPNKAMADYHLFLVQSTWTTINIVILRRKRYLWLTFSHIVLYMYEPKRSQINGLFTIPIHLLIIHVFVCPFCSTFVSLYVHYFIHQWIFWHWWLSSLICYCVFTLIHHYCMHHLESELWINYTKIYRSLLANGCTRSLL